MSQQLSVTYFSAAMIALSPSWGERRPTSRSFLPQWWWPRRWVRCEPMETDGNVWVTDFAGNAAGTKRHQVTKFSPGGEVLMRLSPGGVAG
ncbi:MAG: hypothetical protein VX453_01590 [Acidobacteriota bacterium]|nr:hypothetical protein [Acidobacteriota bacterium]